MYNGKNAKKIIKMLKIFAWDINMYSKILQLKKFVEKKLTFPYASKLHSKFANQSDLKFQIWRTIFFIY